MKIIAGKENLSTILEVAKKLFLIYFSDQKKDESNIFPKASEGFFKMILEKPIIFYCEDGALSGSHHSGKFEDYMPAIHYTEHLEVLWLLYNLPGPVQEQMEIDWVIIEAKKIVNHADLLQKMVFLDYWQESHGKKNTTGKIDLRRLEETIKNTAPKSFGKKIMKKYIKFISYPLLNVKPPQMVYIYPEILYIKEPSEIKIDNNMRNNIYRYKCVICGNVHSVVLSHSKNKKMPSSTTMVRYDKQKKNIEFACGHHNTSFKGAENPYFNRFRRGDFTLNNPNSYDQAFLFIFYRFQRDGDNNIVYTDEKNDRQTVTIKKYLDLYENDTH